jgi:hypothetical protein
MLRSDCCYRISIEIDRKSWRGNQGRKCHKAQSWEKCLSSTADNWIVLLLAKKWNVARANGKAKFVRER